jgi:hypothetical protein
MGEALITEAVPACVRFGALPETDTKRIAALVAIRTSLASIFSVIARAIAANPRFSRWNADAENPGYLIATVGSTSLRAPWNLVTDFPPDSRPHERTVPLACRLVEPRRSPSR